MAMVTMMGGLLQCSNGAAPVPLVVLPIVDSPTMGPLPIANIMCMKPIVNIPPFGVCKANPLKFCIPAPIPWIPTDPKAMFGISPPLNMDSKTVCCAFGGQIEILIPAQFQTMDPG